MKRKLATAVVAIILCGCSAEKRQSPDAQIQDMIEWSKRNPDVSEATWKGVSRLVCKPDLLDVCGEGECRSRRFSNDYPVVLTWSPVKQEFQRCDPKGEGCDTYHPQVSYSGSFANIVVPESAMIFRLTASGEYREIANLANETFVYRGHCLAE